MVFDGRGQLTKHTLDGIPQPVDPAIRVNSAAHSPVPSSDWPLWAKSLKFLAKPEDKGIGDVVARTIGDENSQAFKSWYRNIFNKDCGCAGRQAEWNAKYPLSSKPSANDAARPAILM